MNQQTADKIKDYGNDLVDKGGEGWSAFYALADYIDTLVSEDKIGCECDCCRGDHARIAKRMWEKYLAWIKEKICLWNNTMIINGYTNWLDKESEG